MFTLCMSRSRIYGSNVYMRGKYIRVRACVRTVRLDVAKSEPVAFSWRHEKTCVRIRVHMKKTLHSSSQTSFNCELASFSFLG